MHPLALPLAAGRDLMAVCSGASLECSRDLHLVANACATLAFRKPFTSRRFYLLASHSAPVAVNLLLHSAYGGDVPQVG